MALVVISSVCKFSSNMLSHHLLPYCEWSLIHTQIVCIKWLIATVSLPEVVPVLGLVCHPLCIFENHFEELWHLQIKMTCIRHLPCENHLQLNREEWPCMLNHFQHRFDCPQATIGNWQAVKEPWPGSVLCSWHFTLTVPHSTQVYKLVPANLMLGVALWWTSILSKGE